VLWSPDRTRRVQVTEEGGTSTLEIMDASGDRASMTTIQALVSHVRWSPDGERLMFTGGRLAPGGGVLQDLYLWDPGTNPVQLTSTGAAFGAEWRGSPLIWREAD
jgi:Tol biopolymer transport system component